MDWDARIRNRLNQALTTASGPADDDVVERAGAACARPVRQALAEGCSPDEADDRVTAQIDRWRTEAAELQAQAAPGAGPAPPLRSPRSASSLTQDVRYAVRLLGASQASRFS